MPSREKADKWQNNKLAKEKLRIFVNQSGVFLLNYFVIKMNIDDLSIFHQPITDNFPHGNLSNDMNEIFGVLSDEQKRDLKSVAVELKKGEASFHHPLMVRGSFENSPKKPCHVAVINVSRDGVCSDTNEPLLEGVSVVSYGEKITGRFFPLLRADFFDNLH